MSAGPTAVELLASIDASLKILVARLEAAPAAPGATAQVASDRDLDSQYGNPIVKAKDPRDWTGEPMNGRRFSECPAEYLDLVADRLDYFAQQADEKGELASNGKPASQYKRLDAARARGWARRIRAGLGAPAPAAAPTSPEWAADPNDDDVPF